MLTNNAIKKESNIKMEEASEVQYRMHIRLKLQKKIYPDNFTG